MYEEGCSSTGHSSLIHRWGRGTPYSGARRLPETGGSVLWLSPVSGAGRRIRVRLTHMDSRFRGNDGVCANYVIPAKACHGQGTCPRCRGGNFGGIRAFERRRSVSFYVKCDIHKEQEDTGSSIQAGFHRFPGSIFPDRSRMSCAGGGKYPCPAPALGSVVGREHGLTHTRHAVSKPLGSRCGCLRVASDGVG